MKFVDEFHVHLACECGARVTLNDEYMYEDVRKVWDEWHVPGSFVAGKYHKPCDFPYPCPTPVSDAIKDTEQ